MVAACRASTSSALPAERVGDLSCRFLSCSCQCLCRRHSLLLRLSGRFFRLGDLPRTPLLLPDLLPQFRLVLPLLLYSDCFLELCPQHVERLLLLLRGEFHPGPPDPFGRRPHSLVVLRQVSGRHRFLGRRHNFVEVRPAKKVSLIGYGRVPGPIRLSELFQEGSVNRVVLQFAPQEAVLPLQVRVADRLPVELLLAGREGLLTPCEIGGSGGELVGTLTLELLTAV